MNKRKTLLAGSIAAACAVTALVTAAPAQAKVAAWDFCDPGRVCVYQHFEGNGLVWEGGTEKASLGAGNDRASSLWNRSDKSICFYIDQNYGGVRIKIAAGGWLDRIGYLNDQISSWRQC
ncbi:peptidase inhibitor family I36 protein [Spongiactinospora sp. TRM90649]|uniref:peptidase inhibitor family I36 protein n=1 Tax=Spongiactinospora sp. TRM90649 TaxID=3031114 RepID=UPI0023F718E8|nr:peptidase inhibitor family I36 protein [Spongiactinospora sp. TRM90649]MDF5751445.1 peptidase inhibitor family I36 protein [Spongiactinospora sp. TRM90649]